MKSISTLLTTATAALGIASSVSCGEAPEKMTTTADQVLVVYYSWSGNTRRAAEIIAQETGGTLLEIHPATPYPTSYQDCVDQAKKETEANACPAITYNKIDLARFNTIFIGSPNWWSTIAPPVNTFLKENSLAGKTIIPFVTHGGGGMARCERAIRKQCRESRILKGGAFSGSEVQEYGTLIPLWLNKIIMIQPSSHARETDHPQHSASL